MNHLKKLISLLLILALSLSLCGCGGKSYNVDYHGDKDFFKGAKDSFGAGKTVKLVYPFDFFCTDTDYSFRVDGIPDENLIFMNYGDEGYEIEFVMPENDVDIYVESYNTMMPNSQMGEIWLMEPDYEPAEGEVSLIPERYFDGVLTFTIYNNTDEEIFYGADYSLSWLIYDTYEKLDPLGGEMDFIAIAYTLAPGESATCEADLSVYGTLDPGCYKLIKSGYEMPFELYMQYYE